jgi:3-oxoacyl-[acyl-carrier-protein] synthase II
MAESINEAVWITGLGLATPLGSTFREFTDALMAGKSGIRAIDTFDTSDSSCKIAGLIGAVDCPPGWNRDTFRSHTPWEKVLLSCAVRALADAGWLDRRREVRVGLVLGMGAEWMVTWETDMKRGGQRIREPQTDGAGYFRFLQDQLQIQGPASTVAAACASGNIALSMARHWVRRGWVDIAIAGAAELPVTPMGVGGFGNLGALSKRNQNPTAASRPFDRDRDGFVISEGAAMFVLESATSARRRGCRVYGEITGFGATSDAYHLVSPSEDATHAAQAIRWALGDAGIATDQIDYINAHATSTPIGDVFETKALRAVLGDLAAIVPVSSTKSMTGHMVGAASAVEAAVCLAAFDRQAVPPTINLDNPDPECTLCHVRNGAESRRVDIALSNSFGFGGSNTCLALKRVAA